MGVDVWTGYIVEVDDPLFSAAMSRDDDPTRAELVTNFRLAELSRTAPPRPGDWVKLFAPHDAGREGCLLTRLELAPQTATALAAVEQRRAGPDSGHSAAILLIYSRRRSTGVRSWDLTRTGGPASPSAAP